MTRTLACIAITAGLGALSSPVAAGEDDRALSFGLAYGTFDVDEDVTPDGAVLTVDFERGLSDAVSLRVSGVGGLYCDTCLAWTGHATVGITYLFDVLKYVPYAHAGVGAIYVGGQDVGEEIRPLVEVGGGLDILRSREFSWGLFARVEYWPGDLQLFAGGIRLTWRWGFF